MTIENPLDSQARDQLMEAIQRSLSIEKHVEFFEWLQRDVRPLVPHDALISVWGKFDGDRLNYDVASTIPGVETKKVVSTKSCDAAMNELYHRWIDFDQRWFALDNFHELMSQKITKSDCIMDMDAMRFVLVHGVRDKRDHVECLYLFFHSDYESLAGVDDRILNLILPYIDMALRRVESLKPIKDKKDYTESGVFAVLSARELEVLKWLEQGKTNQEIGLILGISVNTVKNHLKRIFVKLDVTHRAQAVSKYVLLFKSKMS
jgi:transcriptional regulator EpsA